MKVVFLALFVTLFVVANADKRCRSAEDCDEGECCIHKGIIFRKGVCTPLAEEGESCSAEEDILPNDRHFQHCPCRSGLTCEPEEIKKLPFVGEIKINERCVSEPQEPKTDEPEPEPETEEPQPETEAPVEE